MILDVGFLWLGAFASMEGGDWVHQGTLFFSERKRVRSCLVYRVASEELDIENIWLDLLMIRYESLVIDSPE